MWPASSLGLLAWSFELGVLAAMEAAGLSVENVRNVGGFGRPMLRAFLLVEAPDGSKAVSKGRTEFSYHVFAAPRSEGKILCRCRILPG